MRKYCVIKAPNPINRGAEVRRKDLGFYYPIVIEL